MRMDKDDKIIKEALKDAQHTLAKRVDPGGIGCDEAINELLTTLDNDKVVEAVMDSDDKEEAKKNKVEKQKPPVEEPRAPGPPGGLVVDIYAPKQTPAPNGRDRH